MSGVLGGVLGGLAFSYEQGTTVGSNCSSSAAFGFTDYSQVDMLRCRYNFVNRP